MSENNILIQFSPTIYICNTDNKEKFKIVTEFNDIVVKAYSAGSIVLNTIDQLLTLSEFNFIFVYSEYPFNIDICLNNGGFSTIENTKIYNIHSSVLHQYCQIKTAEQLKNKIYYLTAIC